jgi:hypothetical protein
MTANERYEELLGEIRDTLHGIEAEVTHHTKRQYEDSKNWGYVGDLAKVLQTLKEVEDGFRA